MKEGNNAFAYISIVAIVAIVAIFVMFAGNNKEIETPNLSGDDLVGQTIYTPKDVTHEVHVDCWVNTVDFCRLNGHQDMFCFDLAWYMCDAR